MVDATSGERSGRPAVEVHSIDYIPVSERHGKPWNQTTLWFASNAILTTLAVGLIGLSIGLSVTWTLVAETLGALVGTLFMALHSVQGPRLGIPQMIQARPQFGFYGALIPQVVALLLYIGFNVFNTILAAQALHVLIGVSINVGLAMSAALALLVGFAGHDVIHLAERWGTWIFIVIFGVLSIGALVTVHPHAASGHSGGFHMAPFLVVFSAATSYQLSLAPYVSDYSRYLQPRTTSRSCFWWTYLGVFGTLWMVWLGTFLASASSDPGNVQAVPVIDSTANQIFSGFGTVCLIPAFLMLVVTVAVNMYCGSLAGITMADSVRRVRPGRAIRFVALAAVCAASTVIAYASSQNFLTNYNTFLTVLLYFLVPWSAINLVDFYLVRKDRYVLSAIFDVDGIYGRWQWRGLCAYAAGFVAMIPFFSTTVYSGPIANALSGADLSFFVGLLVAGVAYYLLARTLDVRAEVEAADGRDDPLADAAAGSVPANAWDLA